MNMKKTIMCISSVAALLGMILTFASCTSKEEKIAQAIELIKQEKVAEAVAIYQELEDVQDTTLLNRLGDVYADGKGIDQDSAKALTFFEKSANFGNPYAMVEIGIAYEYALGGYKKNEKEAFRWYKKAAELDYDRGLRNVGIFYKDGTGVEKDPQKAIEYFKKAIEKGNVYAMYCLGLMYKDGDGVLVNMEEAVKYLQMAADKKDVDAIGYLGEMYADGTGVKKDKKKAFEYFLKGAELGHTHVDQDSEVVIARLFERST